jgi:uncharacterized protein YwqG
MKHFVPVLKRAAALPAQIEIEEKFGGLPWGLPANRWPTCRSCGKPQTMIAQLRHHAERLDLGKDGRILFVFQCNHDAGSCETWAGESGANACLVLEAEELGSGLTAISTANVAIETEVRVLGWQEGIDDESEPEMVTKLGGIPSWVQGDDEGPTKPWRWVGQFDSTHRLEDGSSCAAANYGDLGIAYIYINTAGDLPKGFMFWQCG